MDTYELETKFRKLLEKRNEYEKKLEAKALGKNYTEQFLLSSDKDLQELQKIEKEIDKIIKQVEERINLINSKKRIIEKQIEDNQEELNYTDQYLMGEKTSEINNYNKQLSILEKIKNDIQLKEEDTKEVDKKETTQRETNRKNNENKTSYKSEFELKVEELMKKYEQNEALIEEKMGNLNYTEQFLIGNQDNLISERIKIENELKKILRYIEDKSNELEEKKEIIQKELTDNQEIENYTEQFLNGEKLNELQALTMKLQKMSKIKNDIEKKNIKIAENERKSEEDIKGLQENEDLDDKLQVIYQKTTNTYTIINSKSGFNEEFKLDKRYLSKKYRDEFVTNLEEEYGESFKYAIEKFIDINLYNCLKIYDERMGTNKANDYIQLLDGKDEDSNIDITYNLRGKRKIDILNNNRLNNIALQSEKYGIAKVEKNTLKEKMKYAWKKFKGLFAIGGLIVGTTAIAAISDGKEKGEDAQTYDIKVGESSKKEKFKEGLKVNSKGKINEGTYYYDSEKNGPMGEFENHKGEELKVDRFAIVDSKTGKFIRYATDEENLNIDGVEVGENKVMVHISHSNNECKTTDGGALGWTDLEKANDITKDEGR